MKKLFVSVAGTLGVGKTTFVNFISKEFGYYKVEENFKDNLFLPRFYKNKKRWAFHSEIFFLIEKVKQIQDLEQIYSKKSIVLDSPIYSDVYGYGGALLKEGSMSAEEWQVYMHTFKVFEKKLLRPDLIFYLTAEPEVMYQRIKSRGRSFELALSRKKFITYLALLKSLHDKWIKTYSKRIHIVKIDLNDYNYLHNPALTKKLKLLVGGALKRHEKI